MQAELVLDCKNHHGEGVFWDARTNALWWTDIHGQKLWSYDPQTGAPESFDMPERVACFAPREHGDGFVVAFAQSIVLYDLDAGVLRIVHEFEPDNPDTRLNDGRTDRRGRFIAGGMNEGTGTADSSVLRVDADLSVTRLIDGIACANSTCFSPDGATMYFTDTPEKTIRAYPYDAATGAIGAARIHCDMQSEPGLPDGSCVDADGGVWNAEWEGRRVVRIAPTGEIDRVINVPVWKPTCCAFGGPDLDTLFITTSRLASPDDVLAREPASGGLFAVKPGVRGVADTPFAG